MKQSMLLKVILAMGLAILVGSFAGAETTFLSVKLVDIFGLIGQIFLNALTLVVVPLVAASIITGAARLSVEHAFGSLGLKTFALFIGTVILAVLVGFAVTLFLEPGAHISESLKDSLKASHMDIQLEKQDAFSKISEILLKLIPSNILAVASQGQMLGLIFFSLLFGFFIPKIDKLQGDILLGFWQGLFQVMMKMTHLVMIALPVGVFGLVAKVFATTGLDAFKPIGFFFFTVLAGLFAFSFIILPLLLKTLGGVNPIRHFKAVLPALLTAFSTSSSAATLPISIECVEKRAGVSNRITSFTLPLATTLNLAGTALYTCSAALFICQAYGVEMNAGLQATVILMSILTSFGMAGIPSASIVAIIMILHTAGLPSDGIALILAVERILDMFRTVVNVLTNTCCSVIVAKTEGEKRVLSQE